MKIEVLPNVGPASMVSELTNGMEWATNLDIASAFVTTAALERLELALIRAQKAGRNLTIRLLVGLYQRFTSAATIAKAVRMQQSYPEQFSIRIARNQRFHWKLYTFRRGHSRRLYVGSANLTEDGLRASGELCVKITAQDRDQVSKTLAAEFTRLWTHPKRSFAPSTKFLRDYRGLKRPPKTVRTPADAAVRRLLQAPKKVKPTTGGRIASPCLIFTDAEVTDQTRDSVVEETDWETRGWLWACLDKHSCERLENAGVVLWVEATDPRTKEYTLDFFQLEETAHFKTPDGSHFAAMTRIPHGWTRHYSDIRQVLRRVGLTAKKVCRNRYLTSAQVEVLCNLLHVSRERLRACAAEAL